MRVQCSICTELFDNGSEISALPCGHTFHEACANRWLHQSLTCPQCRERCQRNRVIKRLFFSEADIAEEDGEDPSRLKNELETAKVAVRQKESEKQVALKERVHTEKKLEEMRESFGSMETLYRQERASSHALQREVNFYKKMVKDAEIAKEEAKALRKKLESFKAVEKMIHGSETEVQDVIHSNTDPTQIATWCSVLQRELQGKRQEVRTQRDTAERQRRELASAKKTLKERAEELVGAQEHAKSSEESLARAEGEISSLKKKIGLLQNALGSPSDSAVSFAHRLINESPAPMPSAVKHKHKRPRLSEPDDDSHQIDLDMTPDLFDSPAPVKPSPTTHQKKQCQEYGTSFVKITSAAAKVTKTKRDLQDVSNVTNIAGLNLNLFKKKNGFALPQEPSAIRKGYNGLGGHEKFLQSQHKGVAQPKKNVFKQTGKIPRNFGTKIPPFPSLE